MATCGGLSIVKPSDVNRRGGIHMPGEIRLLGSFFFFFLSLTNQLCQTKSFSRARGTALLLFWCLTATHVGSGQAEQSSHAQLEGLQSRNPVDESRRPQAPLQNRSFVTFFRGLEKLARECQKLLQELAGGFFSFFLFNYSFTILAVRNYFYSESMNGEMIGSRSSEHRIR